MKTKFLILGLALAMLVLAGCVQSNSTDNTINAAGNSELTLKPDQAEITAGVSILRATAKDAQDEASRINNAIIAALKAKGLTESEIQTESVNLYEDKSWENNQMVSNGWRATQTLKAKTKDLTKVGDIVDAFVTGGANQIDYINFGLSNEKEQEYKMKALADATANAKAKAETIATSLGVKLGKIKTVSESNYYYNPYRYDMMNVKAVPAASAEAAQVLPKDVTVTASVNLVYSIR